MKENKTNKNKVKRYKKTNVIFPVIGGIALVGGAAAGIAIGVTHLPVVRAEENTVYVSPDENVAKLTFNIKEDVEGDTVSLSMLDTEASNEDDADPKVIFAEGLPTQQDALVIDHEVKTSVKLSNPPKLARDYTYEFSMVMTYTNGKGKKVERTIKNLKLVYVCEALIHNDEGEDSPARQTPKSSWKHDEITGIYHITFKYTGFRYIGLDVPPRIETTEFGEEFGVDVTASVCNFGYTNDQDQRFFDVELTLTTDKEELITKQSWLSGYMKFFNTQSDEEIKVSNELIQYKAVSVVVPEEITVTLDETTITPTGTTTATASAADVDWSSTDETVATVVKSGTAGKATVTGVGSGSCSIIAKSTVDPTIYGAATITVKAEGPTKITVSIDDDTIPVNGTTIVTAEADKEGQIDWSSSDTSVATVDKVENQMVVTAKKAGEATIIAESHVDPDVKGSVIVHVTPLPTSVSVSLDKDTITVGDTAQAYAKILPEGAETNVTWSISPQVDNIAIDPNTGKITTEGATIDPSASKAFTITATPTASGCEAGTAQITINPTSATGITVNFEGQVTSIVAGQSIQSIATANPSGTLISNVSWLIDSEDEGVTIDPNSGLISTDELIENKITVTVKCLATNFVGKQISGEKVLTVTPNAATSLNVKFEHTAVVLNPSQAQQNNVTISAIGGSMYVTDDPWATISPSDQGVTPGEDDAGNYWINIGTNAIPGEYTVTVHANQGSATGTASFVVLPVQPTGVNVTLSKTDVSAGQTNAAKATATILPAGAVGNIKWTVDGTDTGVSIDNEGNITTAAADASGDVAIRATIVGTSVTKTATLTVHPKATQVTFDLPTSIEVGETISVDATVTETGALKDVTWSSDKQTNVQVTKVDSDTCYIKGLAAGENISITATNCDGISSTKTFKVVEAPIAPTSLTFKIGEQTRVTETTLNPGGTVSVEAILSENADLGSVIWKSSNPTVANVDNPGTHATTKTITAGSYAGQAVITAQSDRDPTVLATLTVFVQPAVTKWAETSKAFGINEKLEFEAAFTGTISGVPEDYSLLTIEKKNGEQFKRDDIEWVVPEIKPASGGAAERVFTVRLWGKAKSPILTNENLSGDIVIRYAGKAISTQTLTFINVQSYLAVQDPEATQSTPIIGLDEKDTVTVDFNKFEFSGTGSGTESAYTKHIAAAATLETQNDELDVGSDVLVSYKGNKPTFTLTFTKTTSDPLTITSVNVIIYLFYDGQLFHTSIPLTFTIQNP